MAEVENNNVPEIRIASDHTYNKRMYMCINCDQYIKETKTCATCLCIMPYKARNADSWCPLHKWEAE